MARRTRAYYTDPFARCHKQSGRIPCLVESVPPIRRKTASSRAGRVRHIHRREDSDSGRRCRRALQTLLAARISAWTLLRRQHGAPPGRCQRRYGPSGGAGKGADPFRSGRGRHSCFPAGFVSTATQLVHPHRLSCLVTLPCVKCLIPHFFFFYSGGAG